VETSFEPDGKKIVPPGFFFARNSHLPEKFERNKSPRAYETLDPKRLFPFSLFRLFLGTIPPSFSYLAETEFVPVGFFSKLNSHLSEFYSYSQERACRNH
jgi:hypothetical protein